MARMSELHFSLPKIGSKDQVSSAESERHSDALAEAETLVERRAAFVNYIESDEFGEDCRKAADLVKSNDRDGLVEHASQDAPKRAAARVAAIRASQ